MMSQQGTYVKWVSELFPEQGKWTEEDYFALPETNRIIELSDGQIRMSPYPTPLHQLISDNLQFWLSSFVREHGLGRVLSAPTAVRLWEGKVRGPDLIFLRTEHLHRMGAKVIEGPPDWVAEIISLRSRKIDRVEKLAEYAEAGIPEYWLIDPDKQMIRVYLLEENEYRLTATYKAGDMAKSEAILGFEVAISEIFAS